MKKRKMLGIVLLLSCIAFIPTCSAWIPGGGGGGNPLYPPSLNTVTEISPGVVKLTWSGSTGYSYFCVYRGEYINGDWSYSVVRDGNQNIVKYYQRYGNDNWVPEAGDYRYKVRAFRNSPYAVSSYSNYKQIYVCFGDYDQDGLPDEQEINGFNILINGIYDVITTDMYLADTDGDGIDDYEEVNLGTDGVISHPDSIDGDGDSLTDVYEIGTLGTNPCEEDTDGDLMPDAYEIQYGFDPLDVADGTYDFDGDGLTNTQEYQFGYDPTFQDGTMLFVHENQVYCGVAYIAWDADYELIDLYALNGYGPYGDVDYVGELEDHGYLVLCDEAQDKAPFRDTFMEGIKDALTLADYYNTRLFMTIFLHGWPHSVNGFTCCYSQWYEDYWYGPPINQWGKIWYNERYRAEDFDITESDIEQHAAQNFPQFSADDLDGICEELTFYSAPCYAMEEDNLFRHTQNWARNGVYFGKTNHGLQTEVTSFYQNFIRNAYISQKRSLEAAYRKAAGEPKQNRYPWHFREFHHWGNIDVRNYYFKYFHIVGRPQPIPNIGEYEGVFTFQYGNNPFGTVDITNPSSSGSSSILSVKDEHLSVWELDIDDNGYYEGYEFPIGSRVYPEKDGREWAVVEWWWAFETSESGKPTMFIQCGDGTVSLSYENGDWDFTVDSYQYYPVHLDYNFPIASSTFHKIQVVISYYNGMSDVYWFIDDILANWDYGFNDIMEEIQYIAFGTSDNYLGKQWVDSLSWSWESGYITGDLACYTVI